MRTGNQKTVPWVLVSGTLRKREKKREENEKEIKSRKVRSESVIQSTGYTSKPGARQGDPGVKKRMKSRGESIREYASGEKRGGGIR